MKQLKRDLPKKRCQMDEEAEKIEFLENLEVK